MTPFGKLLEKLRRSRGLQQSQLAAEVGINPCYVSAMEKGRKGPAARETLTKIVSVLDLAEAESYEFWLAVEQSKRTKSIPESATTDEYVLIHELWNRLGSLSSDQIEMMRLCLKVSNKENRRRFREI